MIGRDSLLFIGSVIFFAAFSLYSYAGYQQTVVSGPLVFKQGHDVGPEDTVLNEVTVAKINRELSLSAIDRNPFEKVRKEQPPKETKPKIVLPPPKIELKPVEPIIEEPEEVYIYRGKVVLGNSIKYVLERERDGKTFFVFKGFKNTDFLVLDATDKEVVVIDYDEKIRVFKKIK